VRTRAVVRIGPEGRCDRQRSERCGDVQGKRTGIAVIGEEGCATSALKEADVVVTDIVVALECSTAQEARGHPPRPRGAAEYKAHLLCHAVFVSPDVPRVRLFAGPCSPVPVDRQSCSTGVETFRRPAGLFQRTEVRLHPLLGA
jgi:hypothetical protein